MENKRENSALGHMDKKFYQDLKSLESHQLWIR